MYSSFNRFKFLFFFSPYYTQYSLLRVGTANIMKNVFPTWGGYWSRAG